MNTVESFWDKKHTKYKEQDWITKPTIFAEAITQYLPPSGKILDIGAGQAQDSVYFAGLGYSVIATDISQYALDAGKEFADKLNTPVQFMKLDVSETLPFEDNEFDVIYAHLSLHYFDETTTEKIFKEIQRVLKSGRIIAALFNTVDDPETKDPSFRQIEPDFYEDADGIRKRYFSVEYVKKISNGLFEPILLDGKGETHKDSIKSLIRFVGRKI